MLLSEYSELLYANEIIGCDHIPLYYYPAEGGSSVSTAMA